ncbi:cellulose synthase operon protein D [Klebsiella pneumoniae]|nr:cellulose synthase operon protein D [Klebsiella pneumoniae]
MMTENNNPVVMTWFQQQQTPAGWFDLLIIMIEGMLNNAGELESQPFLRQMGASLAETHPLPASGDGGGSGGQYQPAADSFSLGRGDHRCR